MIYDVMTRTYVIPIAQPGGGGGGGDAHVLMCDSSPAIQTLSSSEDVFSCIDCCIAWQIVSRE